MIQSKTVQKNARNSKRRGNKRSLLIIVLSLLSAFLFILVVISRHEHAAKSDALQQQWSMLQQIKKELALPPTKQYHEENRGCFSDPAHHEGGCFQNIKLSYDNTSVYPGLKQRLLSNDWKTDMTDDDGSGNVSFRYHTYKNDKKFCLEGTLTDDKNLNTSFAFIELSTQTDDNCSS